MRIKRKITLWMSVVAALCTLLTVAVLGVVSSNISSQEIKARAKNQLVSIRDSKKSHIENYFQTIRNQVLTLSESTMVVDAMEGLSATFKQVYEPSNKQHRIDLLTYYEDHFGKRYAELNPNAPFNAEKLLDQVSTQAIYWQWHYIYSNPHPLGSKHLLNQVYPPSRYHYMHSFYHPKFTRYLELFEYYDIFLVDAETGNIVYSVFKELDYGTSLKTGPYADSGLARAYKQALKLEQSDQTVLIDFSPYQPSYESQASFIGSPIKGKNGDNIGVLIFQIPIVRINDIMTDNQAWEDTGLGLSGEAYLVGDDYKARSLSRLLIEDRLGYINKLQASNIEKRTINQIDLKNSNIGLQTIRTQGVEAALAGEKGFSIFPDSQGTSVLSAYTPLDIEGLNWVLMSEIGEDEAFSGAQKLKQQILNTSLIICFVATAVCFVIGFFVSSTLSRPVTRLSTLLQEVERNNDLTLRSDVTTKDEVGDISAALNSMLDRLLKTRTDLQAQMETERLQLIENNRIRQALDNVTANVMITDDDLNITYVNPSVQAMFQDHETAIQQDLPQFSVSHLIGTPISMFHNTDAPSPLQPLNGSDNTHINVGGRHFNMIANLVIDDTGAHLGIVVEWVDLTEQLNAEHQVQTVIDAAVAGKLNTRLDTERLNGFMNTLAKRINHLLDTIIAPINLSANYMERIAVGDIPEPITEEYQGDFNTIKNNLNTCIASINRLLNDTNALATAAVAGQLETRAEEALHQGDFRKIIVGVNSALDAIVSPINECKQVMESLSKGDLTLAMQGHYEGEFNALKNAINSSLANLLKVVEQVSHAATNVDTASTEIASGIADLSQRTESQATSLEQTAASMEEMTSITNNNADNAQSADQLAKAAQEKALEGGRSVEQTIASMMDINDASKKITDIIGVIDELAFQTNLLALNAAVEAARAGEQGRGFAVVATEVRTLAQRSAEAAGEIKDLINDSVSKIETGSHLVNKSGDTLSDIVAAVQKVCETIEPISTASIEQRSGIGQVNDTITHIEGMTQQNAALVEEASAASQSMSEQASYMQRLLANFKTH